MDKGKIFRDLHASTFVMPNPWDPGTTKLLASFGFKALATTSAGFAFSRGLPDGAVTFEQMIHHCREVTAATSLPVSADLEKGKGDSAEQAAETIFAAQAAGLAGCSIEDHTGDPDNPIYDFSHAVERVAAAAEAARALKHDFVFTARAENFLWGKKDLDDTIKRLQAFEKAGADVLYAPGVRDLAAIRAVTSAVSRPVNVVMSAADPSLTLAQLAEAGVKRVSVGGALSRLALAAFLRGAREMRDKGGFTWVRDTVPSRDLKPVFRR